MAIGVTELTIAKIGSDGMRLTTVDSVVTSQIDLQRSF